MFHYEGGWAGDVDVTEEKARQNYIKKKLEKNHEGQDIFTDSCRRMCRNVKDIIKMNNQIDMYEEYFDGEEPDHNIEKLSVKTSLLFKDPEKGHKRCINKISWHPDGPTKLAGAYCMMRFHKPMPDLSCRSFVWDLKSPNSPLTSINPPSPITALAYNHKNVDDIAFGTYNGRVGFVDVRVSNDRISPDQISDVEESHHEPVMDVIWLSSKLNNEFVTSSSDGKIMWWDNRKLSKPIDKLYICETDLANKGEDGLPTNLIGGTSLEFVPDHGPKYLIGTEKGSIMLANKKPKKSAELNYNVSYGLQIGRHLGPIYSIKRNPTFLKYFMSVGDWSVNIWEEETKTPIMKTRYHQSYLTDGCWSPQRPGVFFVTRKDGWLDIWDFYYRQNEVAFSHKVSESALTCIKVNNVTGTSQIGVAHYDNGKFVAIGDNEGTITLLELCKTLYEPQLNEAETLKEIFEREKKREDHLKNQRMQFENKAKAMKKEQDLLKKEAEQAAKVDVNKQMQDIQEEFEKNLKKAADDLYKVYLEDPEMAAQLTERLAHGGQKKATKDIKNAQEVVRVSAVIPEGYDKKVSELSEGASIYYPASKETLLTSFTPLAADKFIVSSSKRGDNGREVAKVSEYNCNAKQTGEKDLITFDKEVPWDASFKDKKPSVIQDLCYLFSDFSGRLVGIEKSGGKVLLMDYDAAKGTVTNTRIIAECFCPEKCGAAISRDKKSLFYIDKNDTSKIWKHDLTNHKRVSYLGSNGDPYHEIHSFCIVNDETLFVAFKNGKVCRFDMEKGSYERAVQLEGVPLYVCSFLNHVALVGNLKDVNKQVSEAHEILLLDHELREAGRYNLREFSQVVCMSMKMSVNKMPIIIVGTQKQIFVLKVANNGKLEKLNMKITLTNLKGEGIHSFKVFKNTLIVFDKEGFLLVPIKGDIDDQEQMMDLANQLEENADKIREAEDKAIQNKAQALTEDLKKKQAEDEKKKKEAEEAEKKRQEEIKKELDFQNQAVYFMNPQLIYHKINGKLSFTRF